MRNVGVVVGGMVVDDGLSLLQRCRSICKKIVKNYEIIVKKKVYRRRGTRTKYQTRRKAESLEQGGDTHIKIDFGLQPPDVLDEFYDSHITQKAQTKEQWKKNGLRMGNSRYGKSSC